MKVGLGLYRHMLTREYYDFARQAGCTHVVIHMVDYFNQGSSNPRNNQPTGSKYEPWGVAGDPDKLWAVEELKRIRQEIEGAGLSLAAVENIDPAHWYDVLLDGPQRSRQIETVKTVIRHIGEAGIPVLGYNFSLAGVAGRVKSPFGRGHAIAVGMDGPADEPLPLGVVWNMVYDRAAPHDTLPSVTSEELWRRLERSWRTSSRWRKSPACSLLRTRMIRHYRSCASSPVWFTSPTYISACSIWCRAGAMLWSFAWGQPPK